MQDMLQMTPDGETILNIAVPPNDLTHLPHFGPNILLVDRTTPKARGWTREKNQDGTYKNPPSFTAPVPPPLTEVQLAVVAKCQADATALQAEISQRTADVAQIQANIAGTQDASTQAAMRQALRFAQDTLTADQMALDVVQRKLRRAGDT